MTAVFILGKCFRPTDVKLVEIKGQTDRLERSHWFNYYFSLP